MYLSGHDTIMNDILDDLTPQEKALIGGEALRRGLYYPDLPCGKYDIDGKHVFMAKKTTCNLWNLIKLYDPKNNEFYEIFQSHKGILAYLHSMTPNPSFTVKDVRDSIVMQICGFFLLAVYDRNLYKKQPEVLPDPFWLGALLHIVMDSYSPAHAIRSNPKKITIPPRSPYTPSRLMRKRIRDTILDAIRTEVKTSKIDNQETFIERLRVAFQHDQTALSFIDRHNDQLYTSFLNFTFDTQLMRKTKKNIKVHDLSHDKPNKYDIKNFMYYNNQFNFYHQRKDFLYTITRDKHLYSKMVKECSYIVQLYLKALTSNGFDVLQTLYDFLLSGPYRICKEDLKSFTGPIDMD